MAALAEEMAARSIYRISESKNSAATTRNRWLLAVGMFTALGAIGTTNTDHPQILVAPRPGSAVENFTVFQPGHAGMHAFTT